MNFQLCNFPILLSALLLISVLLSQILLWAARVLDKVQVSPAQVLQDRAANQTPVLSEPRLLCGDVAG